MQARGTERGAEGEGLRESACVDTCDNLGRVRELQVDAENARYASAVQSLNKKPRSQYTDRTHSGGEEGGERETLMDDRSECHLTRCTAGLTANANHLYNK